MFFAPSRNPYSTVVRLTDDPHLSGYISAPNLERLRGSPSLIADQLGGGSRGPDARQPELPRLLARHEPAVPERGVLRP
jgi:hypothetical protein